MLHEITPPEMAAAVRLGVRNQNEPKTTKSASVKKVKESGSGVLIRTLSIAYGRLVSIRNGGLSIKTTGWPIYAMLMSKGVLDAKPKKFNPASEIVRPVSP